MAERCALPTIDARCPSTIARCLTVYEGSEGAIKLADNAMALSMTRHIDIKYHCIREMVDVKQSRL
jgi:hypothetical protein